MNKRNFKINGRKFFVAYVEGKLHIYQVEEKYIGYIETMQPYAPIKLIKKSLIEATEQYEANQEKEAI